MWSTDDVERLAALSEYLNRRILGWVRRHRHQGLDGHGHGAPAAA